MCGEVFVGVVFVVFDGVFFVVVGNWMCELNDLIVYVEMLVICEVCVKLGNEWLMGCDFYVMLELCFMCVSVISYVCIVWVYYGVFDFKLGGVV